MDRKDLPYYSLPSSDGTSDEADETTYHLPLRWRHRRWWWWWSSGAILGSIWILIASVLVLIYLQITTKVDVTNDQCTRQLSKYSPALDAVEYINVKFMNEFNATSLYSGPPTPERETAWERLSEKHGIEIPSDMIASLGHSESDNLMHVPENVGTGYVAGLEVFHQLHCLNMIRMYTWYQADEYPGGVPEGLSSDPAKNRMHIDHCIETLRLSLQCCGDVTPLFIRLDGMGGAMADFNTVQSCRNFDRIERWIDENWTVN